MDLSLFMESIRVRVRRNGSAEPRDIEAVEARLERHPTSAALWILRGDLILLCEGDAWAVEDALDSYRTALRFEPHSAEAHEELGHYFYAVEDRPDQAEIHLSKAIELGAGATAHEALGRVMHELRARAN
jgi:cytochrome c-type biogenesis protein CcmH/NrfG